jgi:hypothetical protein
LPITLFVSSESVIVEQSGPLAVSTSAGFAYMMQLVGWEATKVARQRAEPPVITYGDVVIAIPEAQRTLSRSVLFHIDQRLSPTEKGFLVAMAHDSGPTKMKDIRERMGQTAQYVNVYRNRLLDAGLIRQFKHGYVDFAIPGTVPTCEPMSDTPPPRPRTDAARLE